MIKTASKTLIYVHAVFTPKYRAPLIRQEIESRVYSIMRDQFIRLRVQLIVMNGMPDHVHALFILPGKYSIAEVMQRVKGASSKYINDAKLVPGGFGWQDGYGAFSVSEREVRRVEAYIREQKKRHGSGIVSEHVGLDPAMEWEG